MKIDVLSSLESNIEQPKFTRYSGRGKLLYGERAMEAGFMYYFIDGQGYLLCDVITPIDVQLRFEPFNHPYGFIGYTGNKLRFEASSLLLIETNGPGKFLLLPKTDVIIGEPFVEPKIDRATYFLNNCYEVNFSLRYGDFLIVADNNGTQFAKHISKIWNIPQTGCSVTIINEGGDAKDYTELINCIVWLLNLGLGTNITFPKRRFVNGQKSFLEISNCASFSKGITNIIDKNRIEEFLKMTLPYFKVDFNERFEELRLLTQYINGTDHGFLDDRIMALIQAFEIAAKSWSEEGELSEEKKELKRIIKSVLAYWYKKYPKFKEEKGFLNERVARSLTWDKAINNLNKLMSDFGIDKNKLDIDLRALVGYRNKVAHEGKIMGQDNIEVAQKLIQAQFALRLVILKRLNFNDLVVPPSGWYDLKPFKSYFVN